MQLNGSRLYGTFHARFDASTNRRFNEMSDPDGPNVFNQANQMNQINQKLFSRFARFPHFSLAVRLQFRSNVPQFCLASRRNDLWVTTMAGLVDSLSSRSSGNLRIDAFTHQRIDLLYGPNVLSDPDDLTYIRGFNEINQMN